jgi:preprotein translocase subunit Sec63
MLAQESAALNKDFDPHEVLGVEQGTFNTKEIKKSYRKLSLVYHPDKVDQS